MHFILVFADDRGIFHIADGRERIRCIRDFMNDKFRLMDGSKFSTMQAGLRRRLEDATLDFRVIHSEDLGEKIDILDRLVI